MVTHWGNFLSHCKSTFFSKVISACGYVCCFLEESSFLSRLPLYMCQSWRIVTLPNTTGLPILKPSLTSGSLILQPAPSLITDINNIPFFCLTQPNFSLMSTPTPILLFTTVRHESWLITGHPGLLTYLEEVIKANIGHHQSMRVCFIFNNTSLWYPPDFTPSLLILANLFK